MSLAYKLGRTHIKIPAAIRKLAVEYLSQKIPAGSGYYGKSFVKKLKLFVNASRRIEQGGAFISLRSLKKKKSK